MARLRVLMWAPDWDNRWLPYFKDELGSRYDLTTISTVSQGKLEEASKDKDLFISMWGEGIINFWNTKFPGVPIISYLRRYELFYPPLFHNVLWDRVDALIFVNDAIRQCFYALSKRKPKRSYTIYNAVDLDAFPLLKSKETVANKIALVCKMTYIKNVPLAIQILSLLPKEYTLHHIGKIDQRGFGELMFYAMSFCVKDRIIWHPAIPASEMPKWYADKDFILSTSINEGNPNNVIEGMACGLKPVVHAWPGALDQFPKDSVFKTVDEAVSIIKSSEYDPISYRRFVEKNYSLDNIKKIHQVIQEVTGS